MPKLEDVCLCEGIYKALRSGCTAGTEMHNYPAWSQFSLGDSLLFLDIDVGFDIRIVSVENVA